MNFTLTPAAHFLVHFSVCVLMREQQPGKPTIPDVVWLTANPSAKIHQHATFRHQHSSEKTHFPTCKTRGLF